MEPVEVYLSRTWPHVRHGNYSEKKRHVRCLPAVSEMFGLTSKQAVVLRRQEALSAAKAAGDRARVTSPPVCYWRLGASRLALLDLVAPDPREGSVWC